jgi:hypothetical protein
MKKLIVPLTAAIAFMAASQVSAATANVAVPVSITLTPLCVLTAPPTVTLAYTSFAGAVTSAAQSGTVKCTGSRPYKLSWDSTTDTVTTTPTLTSLGLNYTLSLTAGATGTGDGNAANYSVEGTISGNQAGTCATGATCTASPTTTLYVHY